jgi:hypothetical protein
MATKVTNSISEYIQGNLDRKNVRWLFKNGELMFELQQDVWASEEIFDEFYPIYDYVKFNDKGSNPDKTKIK